MIDLTCPVCGEKLPYANAKMNSDKSVKVWRRVCRGCGLVVTDTGVFSREISAAQQGYPRGQKSADVLLG